MLSQSNTANIVRHNQHFSDRIAMFAIRTIIKLQPAPDLGPRGRDAFDKLMTRTPKAAGVTYENATVGGISGCWCRPADARADAAILYLHGGAYVVGSAQAYRNFAGQIGVRARVPTFVADYSLAPERPFPAAVDDAEAAYRGLADAGFSKIAIAGDSAGGGLALVTTARMSETARRNSKAGPVAVVAISPWTDLAMTGTSITTRAKRDPVLKLAMLKSSQQFYLGQTDPKNPLASPLYADLAELPPVLLHVGEDEILLDDALRYADRVGQAPLAEVHVWKGMTHVFPVNSGLLRAARDALDNIGAFLAQHLTN
jgi:monoterpene epsilon-lactone hydrolase